MLLTFTTLLYIISVVLYIVRCVVLNNIAACGINMPTDEELICRFNSGDDRSFEELTARYLGLISAAVAKYRDTTPDFDDADFIQEGLVGLLSACRSYTSEGGMSFKNYLMLCVENRFRSIARAGRKQSAVPTQNLRYIEEEAEYATDPTVVSVSEEVETKEYIAHLHTILKDRLSDLEYKVALLHLSGYSYKEISEKLSVTLKTVDNAQTRIRKKLSGNTPRRDS